MKKLTEIKKENMSQPKIISLFENTFGSKFLESNKILNRIFVLLICDLKLFDIFPKSIFLIIFHQIINNLHFYKGYFFLKGVVVTNICFSMKTYGLWQGLIFLFV